MRAMLCVVALASSAGHASAATQTTDYCLTETLDGDLGNFIMKARLVIAGRHFVLDAWNVMPDNPQTLEIHADGTYRPKGPTPIRFIDNWENRGRGTFTATKSKLHIDIDTVTTSPGGANIGRNYGAYDLTSHRCTWDGQ
jgi:hypothetical protein